MVTLLREITYFIFHEALFILIKFHRRRIFRARTRGVRELTSMGY